MVFYRIFAAGVFLTQTKAIARKLILLLNGTEYVCPSCCFCELKKTCRFGGYRKFSLAARRQILSVPQSATKTWPKADILEFQTDKQGGQTLEFGSIIIPPRKTIRRDKFDFLKSHYSWDDPRNVRVTRVHFTAGFIISLNRLLDFINIKVRISCVHI